MKAQITFDMGIAIIAIALMIYFGFYMITTLNSRTSLSIKEESMYNRLLSYSDYIVKDSSINKASSSTINLYKPTYYHHSIDNNKISNCNQNNYLGFDNITCELLSLDQSTNIEGRICIRRIVENNKQINKLIICGEY